MFLMIDNYDSFVYNLVRYFKELNEDVLVYRNDEITIEEIEEMKPLGIILSPGPKNPIDSGVCNEIIKKFKDKIPILGICLGHQCIGFTFGAKIIKGKMPMHGKISKVEHNGKGLFKGIQNPFNATRYHSLIIDMDTIPSCFEITATSDDGAIMGINHKEYNIQGVQFHPEAELTEFGHLLLNNYIKGCKK